MLLKTITDYLEEILHRYHYGISNDFTFQVGPQYDYAEKIVKKVLITQYLTLKSIVYAKKLKCNLIICRYGIPCDSLTRIDEISQKYLLLLLQSRISVGILPSSWNYIPEGPLAYLARVLGLNFDKFLLDPSSEYTGMIYASKSGMIIESLLASLHRSLNLDAIQAFINHDTSHRILITHPCKVTPKVIKNARYQECDCIICPAIPSNSLSVLNFYEISYIQVPLHNLVEPTLKRFCSTLAMEFPRIEFEYFSSNPILQTYIRKQNH